MRKFLKLAPVILLAVLSCSKEKVDTPQQNKLKATGVVFYRDYNYGGTASQTLAAGNYTMSQLASLGVPNDWASSVQIPSGWTVTMYQNDNYSGTSWVLTSNTSSFGSLSPSANDQMSSCKITSGVTVVGCAIDGNTSYQTIDGFGFSSAWCGKLTSVKNNALYGTLGFSLLRIRIDQNSSSWGDETANSAAAHAAGVKVLGSEWSPPVAWTSNGQAVGGYLLPSHYGDYANYLNSAANTIKLDFVSFQNEPDMGAIDPSGVVSWSADQMLTFLKNNSATIGKPIVYAESFSFNDAYTDPALNDASAVGKISYVGGHLYGNGLYTHTNALSKGKHVWQTEHYIANSRDDINNAIVQAKEIQDCMYNQFSAYFYWWVYDSDASVNLVDQSGTIYKAGYVAGQFAKWIRPNNLRIGCSYNPTANIYVTAYSGNGIVVVAINNGSSSVNQTFSFSNITGLTTLNVNRTSGSENMASLGTVSLSNNSFTYALPAKSVTTFHQY